MYYDLTVGKIDWSKRGEYIATRAIRRAGDMDIDPSWADEAFEDADAVHYEPDPKSKSGISHRTIGYSPAAQQVLVVITVPDGETLWGVNAWKANTTDARDYFTKEESWDARLTN